MNALVSVNTTAGKIQAVGLLKLSDKVERVLLETISFGMSDNVVSFCRVVLSSTLEGNGIFQAGIFPCFR